MSMFRQLDYQNKVLNAIDYYLDVLTVSRNEAHKMSELAADNPDLPVTIPDFTKEAFAKLRKEKRLPGSRALIPFSPRTDGINNPVPNITLKVPTGGGKTWLAVNSVSKIMNKFVGSNTGFVLWIVPNEAIYRQTLKNLADRSHPYREVLDRAAAGKVKILEKDDRLNAADVTANLCVMLLMLQSANRQTREVLRIFKDRGNINGFMPAEGNEKEHSALIEAIPNLETYSYFMQMVQDSLGNALRIIRPVVVMDEGHKAISDLAHETLYGFNPCFVLELTATPKDVAVRQGNKPRNGRHANILVEITGHELDAEGMIKMPLNLNSMQGDDWRKTLNTAIDKLNQLQKEADMYNADTASYIRPIMLVQVERTGQDQRESSFIHAEDAKEHLLANGFNEDQVAIKTADRNDLAQPENQDLLSPRNRIRAIITKEALQEGWDCPFAYVLCSLAARSNLSAMTQLVGRILRQPYGEKTNINNLDECHVITHRAETGELVKKIKIGLERNGLADLVLAVHDADATESFGTPGFIGRREKFKKSRIFLPKVLTIKDGDTREFDYDTDIAANISWDDFDPAAIAELIPRYIQASGNQLQQIALSKDGSAAFTTENVEDSMGGLVFDPALATSRISNMVLNPFVGRDIIAQIIKHLKNKGFNDEDFGNSASLITEVVVRELLEERNKRAEKLFKEYVIAGEIQFRLRIDGNNWEMPDKIKSSGTRRLLRNDDSPLQRSLFDPIFRDEFNTSEKEVAVYLDSEETLGWWHRNIARRHYGIKAWKPETIYPDFLFSVQEDDTTQKLVVMETKGKHLDNADTAYKKRVLQFLTEHFSWDDFVKAGQLELTRYSGETVQCELVLFDDYKTLLPKILHEGSHLATPRNSP